MDSSWELVWLCLAALAAGAVNSIAGGGTLLTFPALLAGLSPLGAADAVNDREADAARAALEVFLAMEAASWKGANGTALLNDAKDAAFARRFIGDLTDTQRLEQAIAGDMAALGGGR